ncbi:HEAT repeat domain-containing protein, partial [Limnoraphis robusta CCNP1324]|uniref:HEAT repeat domain-containing protein n=1 Tax=Limnoraphis robusta TaxID=1118279 RepID=UPI002B1FF050
MLTIAFLKSNPKSTISLNLGGEYRAIDEKLKYSNARDKLQLKPLEKVRPGDLQSVLHEYKPRIVHFSGHGTGNQGLVVEDEQGEASFVTTEALEELFKLVADRVECVILNACHSHEQAEAIHKHINYVIGTTANIHDDVSIAFSTGFYEALGNGESIEKAFEFGKNRIQLKFAGTQEHETIVFLKKKNLHPFKPLLADADEPENITSPEDVRDFLQQIENNFNKIKVFHRQEPLPLQDQYIPIQVTLERKKIETIGYYTEDLDELKRVYALKGSEESQQTQADWKDAKKDHKNIIVLADPGMGKSTLLRMEAATTAQQQQEKLQPDINPDNASEPSLDEVIFPVFLRLSELAKKEEEILEIIPQLIQKEYPKIYPKIASLFKKKLETGKCLLLLDALDEVPQEQRLKLKEKLNRFVRNYPCSLICTSRIVGYGGTFVEGGKEMEIVPFTQPQTEKYIQYWFKNAEGSLPAEITPEGLIKELNNKPQINGLVQNPLLLSLLCSLYQEQGLTLPARRGQVYTKAVEYMLEKWGQDNDRQHNDPARISSKKQLLRELAYHFTNGGKEVFSSDELTQQIDDYLRSETVSSNFKNQTASDLINELTEQDGIIQKLDREGDQYLFLHRTFQEYFTAYYLQNASNTVDLAKQLFWNYDTHETLTLLAGLMEDPLPLLQALTDAEDDIFKTLLLLAGRCLAECSDKGLKSDLPKTIIEKIHKFWQSYLDESFINSTVIALGKVNAEALKPLIAALNDSESYVRSNAASALGNIGNAEAVKGLIAALNDSESYVRSNAASALGNIGNAEAVKGLIAALNDSDLFVRSNAASALGNIGNAEA